jgi:hypothetical protein
LNAAKAMAGNKSGDSKRETKEREIATHAAHDGELIESQFSSVHIPLQIKCSVCFSLIIAVFRSPVLLLRWLSLKEQIAAITFHLTLFRFFFASP